MTRQRRLPGQYALPAAACMAMLIGAGRGAAAADPPVTLTLKDHRFAPDRVEVPAGERFEIVVINQDDTAAEFESSDMRVEKILAPGAKVTVRAGPLRPGTYKFFDDYHPDTAKGTATAVAGNKG